MRKDGVALRLHQVVRDLVDRHEVGCELKPSVCGTEWLVGCHQNRDHVEDVLLETLELEAGVGFVLVDALVDLEEIDVSLVFVAFLLLLD